MAQPHHHLLPQDVSRQRDDERPLYRGVLLARVSLLWEAAVISSGSRRQRPQESL